MYILATWASTAELEHGFAQYRLVAEGIKKSTTEANIFSQLKVLSDCPCADAVCRPLQQRQRVEYIATAHGNRTLLKFRQLYGGGRNVKKSDVPQRTLKDRRKKKGREGVDTNQGSRAEGLSNLLETLLQASGPSSGRGPSRRRPGTRCPRSMRKSWSGRSRSQRTRGRPQSRRHFWRSCKRTGMRRSRPGRAACLATARS